MGFNSAFKGLIVKF